MASEIYTQPCNPTLRAKLEQERVAREQARQPAERPAPAPAKARADTPSAKRDPRDWFCEN